MKKRQLFTTILAILILMSVVAQVSAITGRLGNSRMLLRLDVGEEVRRNLVIENVNDIPLTIEMVASGDLASNIRFEENEFILQPGEEKKAYFTIKATQPGSTDTQINVMFKPPQGSGVGLLANIIVTAGGEAIGDNTPTNEEDPEGPQTQEPRSGSTFNSPEDNENPLKADNYFTLTPITFLTISTVVLIIIFIILIVYSGKLKRKKRSGRPRD